AAGWTIDAGAWTLRAMLSTPWLLRCLSLRVRHRTSQSQKLRHDRGRVLPREKCRAYLQGRQDFPVVVQQDEHQQFCRLGGAGVSGFVVLRTGRLVPGLTGLVSDRFAVVDPRNHLALQHIGNRTAAVAMGDGHLPGFVVDGQ
nr:hypothetical protein [Tanacetum cinerariifolium]